MIAKLQSTTSVTGTQDGGPSALSKLESIPTVKGALNHMFLGFLQFMATMFNSTMPLNDILLVF
jgi:hypothetical protein